MKKINIILLSIILLLAFGLRFYKLGLVPPSISWDEADVGYNAYSIANFGQDEYGKNYPLFFKSFGDDKHPVHIYLTAISVKFFGLNDFTIRLPAAIFGVLNVILIYFLGKILLKSNIIGLFSAFFLAISPYNIHFSRFNHEVNFMLFFFMLGLIIFLISVSGRIKLLALSVVSFAICFASYHPAIVVVPIIIIFLVVTYFKNFSSLKINFASILILLIFSVLLISNQQLLGTARISQNSLSKDAIRKTSLFKLTQNELMGKINLILIQYSWHFTPQYLFIQGDKNPKLSSQTGEFYWLDIIFIFAGLFYLLYKRTRENLILLIWFFLAPLPAALVAEAPHAARASFMMGSWQLISAAGLFFLVNKIGNFRLKLSIITATVLLLTFFLVKYVSYYYGEYSVRYAIEWQYGMKEIVGFAKANPQYNLVYMTDVRSQPYIFFLYNLKTPLPEFLDTVIFNNTESKSYNLVAGFDKYYFGGINTVEIKPKQGVLYILTPSEYDGLKNKPSFGIKKMIKYPNGTNAFFIIS